MGTFTRFRDIVSSNINAMLDKAEDPVKILKLMVRDMEGTLVEIKSDCAGEMAVGKKIEREMLDAQYRVGLWEKRAAVAVRKGRDDLARDALVEKRRYSEKAEVLQRELRERQVLVAQYQNNMIQMEHKLGAAREKQRTLAQLHIHAQCQREAQEGNRIIEYSEAVYKFEEFENRIERMEAEAVLVNYGIDGTIEQELDAMIVDDDIENELCHIKPSFHKDSQQTTQA
ncbi:MAG: PspA/IM30 family protein [Deltaproteobacteria bacterium]|nr:PspA/IM30 family protein [Deltaproteobacteria bacterium]